MRVCSHCGEPVNPKRAALGYRSLYAQIELHADYEPAGSRRVEQQRRVGEMNVYDLMDVWIDDFDLYNMWLILAEMP